MAGRVQIQPQNFNTTPLTGTFPSAPAAGYDLGSPPGTFTAWSTNNSVYFTNNGQIILWYFCGATAAGATNVLVGDLIGNTGQVAPASTETMTIAASSSGWLGPFSPATYNQQNVSIVPTGALGGSIPANAQGCVVIEFTTTTTLSVRAFQLIPVSP